MQTNNILESASYERASETDKILFILYQNPKISKKKVCEVMCYRVTPVTSVSFLSIFGNKSNKSNKVTEDKQQIFLEENKIKTYLHRLRDENKVLINKSENPPVYELTLEGRSYVERLLKEEEAQKAQEQG